ncbi:Fic family protein [Methylicorpusculum sp.]|uniref:Fic family protein n=2 Tax=Methylicorpusculum sp. TaxID=2713644 RepID=UPI00272EFF03|nr:Fic/DOC family N-terminal domain-containing protein [Methylicorpusculum sp.]MDP2179997.1 Fic/DOC family N-terminal domain-containing protein [Methylicorpusculum sp.]MDP3527851.1 Fic/DOC family N-terminal domain-containing protein [Methylicorpusculum sp.]
MKKSDLCASRQKLLVPVDGFSGAFALIPPLTPRKMPIAGIPNELIHAHEALSNLKMLTHQLPNPDIVMRTLDRREAVLSSQIEGTHSDVNDLLIYEATGSDEGLPKDVLVTLNYVKALDYGLKRIRNGNSNALTNELLLALHAHLMAGVKDFKGTPGEFRKKQNWIGGFKIYEARFVPPPPCKVQYCMNDLELFLHYEPDEEDYGVISIVLRMAIAHAQFETIHPFIDGNGRVGRLLFPLMLAKEDYPPVYLAGFLKSNQKDYYDALANVQLQEKWQDWIVFFAEGVKVASHDSIMTAKGLLSILKRWQIAVNDLGQRSDSAINKLPELLIANPVVSVNQVKDRLGISFPAANTALNKLKQMGIVEQSDRQRNRIFVALEVIKLLNSSPADLQNEDRKDERSTLF